jgi:hypothetical protein
MFIVDNLLVWLFVCVCIYVHKFWTSLLIHGIHILCSDTKYTRSSVAEIRNVESKLSVLCIYNCNRVWIFRPISRLENSSLLFQLENLYVYVGTQKLRSSSAHCLDPVGPIRLPNSVPTSLIWTSKTSASMCIVLPSPFRYATVFHSL